MTKTVLFISSRTVAGVVGNMPGIFVLQSMGHRVWPIPTCLNSNHGGHPHALRRPVEDEVVEGLISNLESNGWLEACDAVFTGHFSSVGQIEAAARWIARLKARNRNLVYCCDPIIGDDAPPEYDPETGGIYVAAGIAEAIRARLVPLCDIVSPNRFELEYLSGKPCSSPRTAIEAATGLGVQSVLATSIPADEGSGERSLATLSITASGVASSITPHLRDVAKGSGDTLIALYLGHRLSGLEAPRCLERAVQTTFEICRRSSEAGAEELMLVECRDLFTSSS